MSIRPWPVLVALFGALCLVVTIWVSIDRHPPEWDYANHLERALDCHRTLANPAADRFAEIMGASPFYPPFVICAAGILYFAFLVAALTAQAGTPILRPGSPPRSSSAPPPSWSSHP